MKTPNLETTQILDELQKVRLNFDYIAFNANTIESLESTGHTQNVRKLHFL